MAEMVLRESCIGSAEIASCTKYFFAPVLKVFPGHASGRFPCQSALSAGVIGDVFKLDSEELWKFYFL